MLSRLYPILRCTCYSKFAAPINSRVQLIRHPVAGTFIKHRKMSTVSDEILNEPARNLDYNQLLEKKKDGKSVLIDVREHSEINETGKLPGSIHIPLNEVEKALRDLSPEEFYASYKSEKPNFDSQLIFSCRSGKRSLKALRSALELGYKKPEKDVPVIFSCKAGGRSRKALALAYGLGYLNAAHYKGGWLDWEENTKKNKN